MSTAWQNRIVAHEDVDPSSLVANPENWRRHPSYQRKAVGAVLDRVGWIQDVIVNRRTGHMIDGHLRVELALQRGETSVPVVVVELSEDEERLMLATLDPLAGMADTDAAMLSKLTAELALEDETLTRLLADISSVPTPKVPSDRPTMADRFVIPPFSVLDARQGYWQERKRQWLAIGIQSELGRGETGDGLLGFSEQSRSHYNASPGGSPRPAATLGKEGKTVRGDGKGRGLARTFGQDLMKGEHVVGERLTWVAGDRPLEDLDETSRKNLAGGRKMARPPHGATVTQNADGTLDYRASNNGDGTQSGTSVFDPVLCELAYRWFCPKGGHILDPFAGGSVRGIVASALGRAYTGIDLSARQIEANREQGAAIVPDAMPTWIVGDSSEIASLAPGEYDLIFSCPPYGDLEVYSDDPRDISTMDYGAFNEAYRRIIAAAVGMLRDDRFACVVVGDIRDKRGLYRNFVAHTIDAFSGAGAMLYNEAILVTAVGSLPIRVGKQFSVSRKLGKTHQNVLVFVKGDPRKATEACGTVDVAMPEDLFGEQL